MKISVVLGTRPEIIKMSPVIDEIIKRNEEVLLIHAGQHYDKNMSENIFQDLNLPQPDYNLHVGSGSHGLQTGLMMIKLEEIFLDEKPDIILVQGDTNVVLAGALVASKLHIPVGHIESGLRSYDNTMPEEINRKVADVCSNLFFVPTEVSAVNLLKENVSRKNIHITGNTVVDTCFRNLEIARNRKSYFNSYIDGFDNEDILLVTIHRAESVDNEERLKNIVNALIDLKEFKIIFPVHPRTMKNLKNFNLFELIERQEHINIISPLGYLDFLMLISKSKLILTDSGGLQEEAVTLNVPVLTLRFNTERPETVDVGANILVGTDQQEILKYSRKILNDNDFYEKMKNAKNPYGDGNASIKILDVIISNYENGDLIIKSPDKVNDNLNLTSEIVEEDINLFEYENQRDITINKVYKNNCFVYPYDDVNLKGSIIIYEK